MSSSELQLPPGLGRPIQGPTALGSDPRRLWSLTRTLAVTDFKLRFFGSALGYLWQLMRPLMLFGVLLVVFTKFLKFDHSEKYFAVGLLLGIVLYQFLNEGTSGSVRSLVARENLVRKIEFPRLAVPLATVLTALFNLGLNLVPVFLFLIASGGELRWTWLELPVLVVLLGTFVLGLAMLLSSLFVRYRDIEPIWDVVMQIMFYATPIFYTVQTVTDSFDGNTLPAHLLMCNPFAAILQQARYAVIDPSHLSAAAAIGGTVRLLVPLGIIAVTLAIGYRVFSKAAPRIAEDL